MGVEISNIVTLDQVISNGNWNIPDHQKVMSLNKGIDFECTLTDPNKPDKLHWKPNTTGLFSAKSDFQEIRVLQRLEVNARYPKAPNIQSSIWVPPAPDEIRMCCDGTSHGNPGVEGSGVVYRNHKGNVTAVIIMNLEYTTAFFAECEAIVEGLVQALQMGIANIWVTSDSKSAVHAFNTDQVPWQLNALWQRVKIGFMRIRFSLVWRELNFYADQAAKSGRYNGVAYRGTFISVQD
ncbi:hypothetical protein GIB67_006785 [Kingdonia uniflora]|uniref:RNase H type-1 domain-containing protein n=1 Tax=Kingdonia uniflora TaxID=39325 RepID=A0A7J7KZW8_9MAGN|nr:hypothetical protein GIB67_006785 [Kingdonia uniflora]